MFINRKVFLSTGKKEMRKAYCSADKKTFFPLVKNYLIEPSMKISSFVIIGFCVW